MRTPLQGGSGLIPVFNQAINTNSEAFNWHFAALFSFTDLSGQSWFFNDRGYDVHGRLTAGGPLFNFSGTTLQPSLQTTSCAIGTKDATASVTFTPLSDPLIDVSTQNFIAGCASGLFDGAFMTIDWGFIPPSWIPPVFPAPTANDSVRVYAGWVGQIELSRDIITITLNSILYQSNIRVPKRMYSAPCQHALFGPGCRPRLSDGQGQAVPFPGPNPASFTITVTITSVDPTFPLQTLHTNGFDTVAYYALGYAKFLSGLNINLLRTIKSSQLGIIILLSPLPDLPVIGDTISITAGCDKSQNTCQTKFNNLNNFGGTPYIPMESVFF